LAHRILQLPLVGLGIALFEIDAPVVETEHGHHAVTVEKLVIGEFGRELRIGVDAVKSTVEFGRDFAFQFKVANVALKADQAQDGAETGVVWEMGHGGLILSIL
jgi:hypothetical protein